VNRRKKIVLIADDEEDLTWSISLSLKRDKKNIRVFCVNSGSAAIDYFDKHEVNLLVTDLRMPDQDGFAIIQHIKEKEFSTKVLVMTAYGSAEINEELMRQGCADYIEKPFEIAVLKQKIYSILEDKSSIDSSGDTLRSQIKRILLMSQNLPELLLTVYQGRRQGKLLFSEGRVCCAELGSKRGKAALLEMLDWRDFVLKAENGVKEISVP